MRPLPVCLTLLPSSSVDSCVFRKGSTLSFPKRASAAAPLDPAALPGKCQLPKPEWLQLEGASSCFLCVDPVSRKNVKSAHSTRNRYSSQWTLTKCQASTPARTLTSDWRTVGSQHGVTVTESDSYSASLSQDTGKPRDLVPAHSPQAPPFPIFYFPHCYPLHSRSPRPQSVSFPAGHKTLDLTELFLSRISFSSPKSDGENDAHDVYWRRG